CCRNYSPFVSTVPKQSRQLRATREQHGVRQILPPAFGLRYLSCLSVSSMARSMRSVFLSGSRSVHRSDDSVPFGVQIDPAGETALWTAKLHHPKTGRIQVAINFCADALGYLVLRS